MLKHFPCQARTWCIVQCLTSVQGIMLCVAAFVPVVIGLAGKTLRHLSGVLYQPMIELIDDAGSTRSGYNQARQAG